MKKDWDACAQECHRVGISEERNEATKDLFLKAAAVVRKQEEFWKQLIEQPWYRQFERGLPIKPSIFLDPK